MKKIILGFLLVLVCAGVFVLLLRSSSPNPVAIIRVVDSQGRPVAGALIRPDGLRPKHVNGHWTWTDANAVKPTPVKTDSHGIARVPYPRYVYEKTETGEISFAVDHPDYCSDRPFRVVSASPPANARLKDYAKFAYMVLTRRIEITPEPVVLKRGGIVIVSGFLGATNHPLSEHLYAQLASTPVSKAGWRPAESGALVNGRIPEGTNAVRLIYLPPKGKACFSDPVTFDSIPGQTNVFRLELKPGIQLKGKLDDAVPRPVIHGRVQVSVASGVMNTNNDKFTWHAWKTINPDGTFSFDSMPCGAADVAVICDGFKSKDGPGKFGVFCMPQVFQLTNQDADITIATEQTATCEITLLNDEGKPVPNAEVSFWPNLIWNGRGSTIYMGWTYNSADVYASGEDFNWRKIAKSWPPTYIAHSDEKGIAIVSNLPAFRQDFAVSHTNYELPINSKNNTREASSGVLAPGETNRVTVILQRQRTQFLESPR